MREYDLILSNDIDSLLSCRILELIKGYKINYFFDFNSIYRINEPINQVIGVDIDFKNLKCWSNHYTRNGSYHNENSANLNNTFVMTNYFDKYAGSTLLEIISYYDFDISKFSDEAKMILWAIDVAYKGFYRKKFRDVHKKWFISVLQLSDLYSILSNHTENDFIEIMKKYNLNSKIWIDKEGYLKTNIKLDEISKVLGFSIELPKEKFIKSRDFQYEVREAENLINIDTSKIISIARTRLDEVRLSIAY
ncbi:hypothetical protein [Thermoanaerobacterium thermosulfurigenes]|uniref:hypothetical protein n=1 Tax=Thermoanaerobacterium thermosulfurigenes TaxID=33950 RepID=UPI003EFABB41